MRGFVLLFLTGVVCTAETAVAPPSIGVIHDCAGRSRRLFGTPGAFVLGPPEAEKNAPARIGLQIEGKVLVVGERRVQLPEKAVQPERVTSEWVTALPFLVRLTAGGATVYRLPMA